MAFDFTPLKKDEENTTTNFNFEPLNTKSTENQNTSFDFEPINKTQEHDSDSALYGKTENIPTQDNSQEQTSMPLEGNVRYDEHRLTYNDRFPDRKSAVSYRLNNPSDSKAKQIWGTLGAYAITPFEFAHNAWEDTKDVTKGMGQIIGQGINKTIFTPIYRMVHDHKAPFTDENIQNGFNFLNSGINSIKTLPYLFQKDKNGNNRYRMQFNQDHPELMGAKNALVQGMKENYGQGDLDMFNLQRMKEGKSPINVDLYGLGESFYAHPLNILDFLGAGEVGKVGKIGSLAKAGEASKFAKTVGNKVVRPRYSENLVINAGQRLLETKPVQSIVNALDNSRLRPATDTVVDFLGLNPDSRLLGTHGSNVRATKLLEQNTQAKNIAERNKAIAENKELLGGLTDAQAKELINNIESGNGRAYIPNFDNMDDFKTAYKDYIVKPPKDYNGKTIEQAMNDFGVTENSPRIIKTPIEDVNLRKGNLEHILNSSDKTRSKSLNRAIDTIENPLIITQLKDGRKYYIKFYNGEKNLKKQLSVIGVDADGNFLKTSMPINRDRSFLNKLKEGNVIYESRKGVINTPGTNIINDVSGDFNPRAQEIREALREKSRQNAQYYTDKDLLSEQAIEDLPINTYAARKYNTPINKLTEEQKAAAREEILNMPESERPFYIPHLKSNKLKASDYFANSSKRYKPNGLKHRGIGLLDENSIYDPVELANRMDAQRIKYANTENQINQVLEDFGQKYNPVKDDLKEGYVPFNPDSYFKSYRQTFDMNQNAMDKLAGLDDVDEGVKAAIYEAIKQLPEDKLTLKRLTKNNNIYQIPEEVAETLGYGKGRKTGLGHGYDMGIAGFKRGVLALSPKWNINNRIGNTVQNTLMGVTPNDYRKAWSIWDNNLFPDNFLESGQARAEKTIIGRTGGGDNGFWGNTARLLGGEFMDTSELKGIKKAGAQIANGLALPGKAINNIVDKAFAFNQFFEDIDRKASYIHFANKEAKQLFKQTGQKICTQEEILKYVKNNPKALDNVLGNVDITLGDYMNMTPFERRTIRRIVPFYSWYRTITRYSLNLAEKNPIAADIVNKISQIEDMQEKNDDIAEYQQSSVPTEFAADITGKPIRLDYGHSNPFSTFIETEENPAGLLSPLITQPYEMMTGNRLFMNRPLTSPYYQNIYGFGGNNGYASLSPENYGEFSQRLPFSERLKGAGLDMLRTTIPGEKWVEKVPAGIIYNLINGNGAKPFDSLYDTGFGGYNYSDGFSKNPRGWSNTELLLKLLFPMQQQNPKRDKEYIEPDKMKRSIRN